MYWQRSDIASRPSGLDLIQRRAYRTVVHGGYEQYGYYVTADWVLPYGFTIL